MFNLNEISSIGWLNNHDGSICLTISITSQMQPVFVSIPKSEFERVGGIDGLKNNKQIVVEFHEKFGAGR